MGRLAAPRFVDIVGPYKKWGGDNTDAYYQFAPVDPARTYKVTGTAGDAVYFSLTVYGGPNDGNYTTRIVGIVNNRELDRAQRRVRVPHGPGEAGWLRRRLHGDQR